MFYFSSRGSSATVWLAKMLSHHPQVVCFSATRSFPPVDPAEAYPNYIKGTVPEISADMFMEGLLECSKSILNEKVFGSVHGYHGIAAKEPCEKRGGIFSYITRHPVSRIHSVFIYYLYHNYYKKYNKHMSNENVHEHICRVLSDEDDLMNYVEKRNGRVGLSQALFFQTKEMLKSILPDYIVDSSRKMKMMYSIQKRIKAQSKPDKEPDEKEYAKTLFVNMLESFFSLESELFLECPLSSAIKMEEMVVSAEYFKNHVMQRVEPKLNLTESYLKSVFSDLLVKPSSIYDNNGNRINIHRNKALSPEEIWNTWPIGMKKIYQYYFEKYNYDSICKAFDYDISFM